MTSGCDHHHALPARVCCFMCAFAEREREIAASEPAQLAQDAPSPVYLVSARKALTARQVAHRVRMLAHLSQR